MSSLCLPLTALVEEDEAECVSPVRSVASPARGARGVDIAEPDRCRALQLQVSELQDTLKALNTDFGIEKAALISHYEQKLSSCKAEYEKKVEDSEVIIMRMIISFQAERDHHLREIQSLWRKQSDALSLLEDRHQLQISMVREDCEGRILAAERRAEELTAKLAGVQKQLQDAASAPTPCASRAAWPPVSRPVRPCAAPGLWAPPIQVPAAQAPFFCMQPTCAPGAPFPAGVWAPQQRQVIRAVPSWFPGGCFPRQYILAR